MPPKDFIIANLPRLKSRRFWRYALVGGSTFLLDFLILIALRELIGLPVVMAATVSYWTAIGYNFTLNRYWTFRVGGSNIQRHAAGYAGLLVFNYGVSIALIWTLTHLGLHYTLAKILAVGLQIPWTYLAYKKIVFT